MQLASLMHLLFANQTTQMYSRGGISFNVNFMRSQVMVWAAKGRCKFIKLCRHRKQLQTDL